MWGRTFNRIHNSRSHVLALLLPERRSELAYSLRIHADMTERYHNDLLDSVAIILSPGSFYLCSYGLYCIVSSYCVRLSCLINEYVMLC